ncbi:MAG: flavin reductase family protein [bacterium]|jgi:flavin reductase (DIM6/NTAB) family NADH-FMN oxidoreductase RutF
MKRPWNRVDLPIYSISSCHQQESNMHICTYVSAVSMDPKRMMVAIYKGTKTIELVKKNPHFVLQLLSRSQFNLIKLLGQSSGHQIDKISRLNKRGLLSTWKEFDVLKDALAYMELTTIETLDAGDHIMHLCNMVSFSNNLPGDPLTLKLLRDKKIIRG